MEHLRGLMVPKAGQAMARQLFPLLGLLTVVRQAMPEEGHEALSHLRSAMRNLLNPFCFLTVNEFEGSLPNALYKDIHVHLDSCKAHHRAKHVTVFKQPQSAAFTTRLSDSSDVIVDTFKGMTVWWTHHVDKHERKQRSACGGRGEPPTREFQLKFRKRDKAKLLPEYLSFVSENSAAHSGKTREVKIHSNSQHRAYTVSGTRRMWEEVLYQHPSTFETLAMDPSLKAKITADLTAFTNDRAFYARTGRAWKRGYLLYGPPGTGKSSMVAAMANFLKYDIFDLELTSVRSNAKLRQLLLQTSNQSIIVMEDIDCSVSFAGSRSSRKPKSSSRSKSDEDDEPKNVTLSGLLNFLDGLWSCCGDGRIFVFTTNHIEVLDKALLRPGRMDMQIELSYCSFPAFRVLAANYLLVQDHPLFPQLEAAFVGKAMTPAQIAELLIKDKSDVDAALQSVLSALESNVPEVKDVVEDTENFPEEEKDSKPDPADSPTKDVSTSNLVSVLQGAIDALESNSVRA